MAALEGSVSIPGNIHIMFCGIKDIENEDIPAPKQ